MLRKPGKTKKIAYAILGTPINQQQHRNPRRKKIDQALRVDETKNIK
jgi:hypothetical protein